MSPYSRPTGTGMRTSGWWEVLYCRQATTYQMYLDILLELEVRDSDRGKVEEYSKLRDIECTVYTLIKIEIKNLSNNIS